MRDAELPVQVDKLAVVREDDLIEHGRRGEWTVGESDILIEEYPMRFANLVEDALEFRDWPTPAMVAYMLL
jgi:hypothetical protein